MKLEASVDINHPLPLVFATYRDKLPELVPYLPNVRDITVTSRQDEGETVKLVNRWRGGGEVPTVVRKFLSADLMEWDDHATWHASRCLTEWRTVVPAFAEAVRAEGTNRFEELPGGRTRVTIAGVIEVDAAKLKMVPRLLAGTVSSAVEGFLVNAIKPNLVAVSKGVEKYLDAQR